MVHIYRSWQLVFDRMRYEATLRLKGEQLRTTTRVIYGIEHYTTRAPRYVSLPRPRHVTEQHPCGILVKQTQLTG